MHDETTSSGESTQLRRELGALTSLRWFAALAVFLFHLTQEVRVGEPPASLRGLYDFLAQGYVGVSFFFVLSGFILTYTYHERLRVPSLRSVGRFYVARFARIYPVHLVTLLLAIPFMIQGPAYLRDGQLAPVVASFVAQLLLVQSFVPLEIRSARAEPFAFHFNGPAWSISTEMFFYALFPLALFLLVGVLRLSARQVLGAAAVLVAVNAVFAWAFRADPAAEFFFDQFPPVRFIDFLVGMGIALLFLQVRAEGRVSPLRGSTGAHTVYEVATVAGLFAAVWFGRDLPASLTYSSVYVAFMAALVFVFSLEAGHLSRLIARRPLRLLGEASFSFYMLHVIILSAAGQWLERSPLTAMPAVFALCLAGSFVLYYAIERRYRVHLRSRGNELVERLVERRNARPHAAAAAAAALGHTAAVVTTSGSAGTGATGGSAGADTAPDAAERDGRAA